jgi:hypothetical protein
MHRMLAFTLLCLCALPAIAANGRSTDIADCARISEVQVPDALHADAELVVYAPAGAPPLTITAEEIRLGSRRFHDPSVTAYHAALHAFLTESGAMATVARSMLNRRRYAQAASQMCQRIIAVHATGLQVEQRFPGFVSPVRVRLAKP